VPAGSSPSCSSFCRTLGSLTAACTALPSFCTMSGGVPLGRNTPFHSTTL